MSSPKPSYFDQPYEILGYRVVGFSFLGTDDIDYRTQLLTAPIYLLKTWESAWDNALQRIQMMRTDLRTPVRAGTKTLDDLLTNPEHLADFRHSVDCGNSTVLTFNSDYSTYNVAITAVLGDERNPDDSASI